MRIRFLIMGVVALVLLLLAVNTQTLNANVSKFIPYPTATPRHGDVSPAFTVDEKSSWAVIDVKATQIERAVVFELVLEGEGEVTIDLELMWSSSVIMAEQLEKRFDSNGHHTVTHEIRIPHRLGDLSLEWQLRGPNGKRALTPPASIRVVDE